MIKFSIAFFISCSCFGETVLTKKDVDIYLNTHFRQHVQRRSNNNISTDDLFELLEAFRLLNDPVVQQSSLLGVPNLLLLISRQITFLLERSGDFGHATLVRDFDEDFKSSPYDSNSISLDSTLFFVMTALLLKTFS